MKKFLLILMAVGLLITGCFAQQNSQVKELNNESIKENEVIEYDELKGYVNTFKIGDIINIENTNYLSSYAIPGRWKHTILYLGTFPQFQQFFKPDDKYYQEILKHYQTKKEILVLDSNSTGVKIRTFDQMANLKKDSYLKAILGHRFKQEPEFIKTYINRALDYLNTPYDYNMITYNDQELYCSELVYYALLAVDIDVDKTTEILNQTLITPTDLSDFLKSSDYLKETYLLEKKNHTIMKTNS